MLGEQQPAVRVREAKAAQLACEQLLLEQLFANPQRHCHRKTPIAARGEREIRLEQPLELEEWLLVEDDVVDVGGGDSRVIQAELYRVAGKARVVLAACESLL